MQIKPISTSKHEHMIEGLVIPISPYTQNCTLLIEKQSNRGIVVDPGDDVPIILWAIENAQVNVEKIWLTHGHLDHAGGAAELRSLLKVEIEVPHLLDSFLPQRASRVGGSNRACPMRATSCLTGG